MAAIRPQTVPKGGWREYQIIDGPMFPWAYITSVVSPGDKVPMPDLSTPVVRCALSNFGSAPAIDATAEITITLRKAILTDDGHSQAGPVIREGSRWTIPASLDAVEREGATYIFVNRTNAWAEIRLPKAIKIRTIEGEEKIVPLLPTASEQLGLPEGYFFLTPLAAK
jgi:hypothetical protein